MDYEEQLHGTDTKVYKKRWFVIALLVWLMFLYVFTCVNFGYLNNVMVAYFDTTYAAIDWMVLSCEIGTIVASPVIACFALSNLLSCKKAMITSSVFLTVGFALIIIGFLQPHLYFLVTLGQVFNGFAGAIVFALPGPTAELWFDETQIGIATGIALLGSSSAVITANILPPQLLRYVNIYSKIDEGLKIVSNSTFKACNPCDKHVYIGIYFTMALTSVVTSILLCTCIPEKPKLAPSRAQYLERSQEKKNSIKLQDLIIKTKNLCCDYMFIAANIAVTLVYYLTAFDDLSVELIVSKVFLNFTEYTPEEISGFLIATVSFGCVVTNIFSGLLLDKFKNYYWQSNIAALFVFIFSIITLISVYYQTIVLLIISFFLTGFSKRACLLSLIDSLMQHTYPINPLFVMSVAGFLQNITALLFINIGRQIIYETSITGGLIYVCAVIFLLCILCFSYKPLNHRLKANKCQPKEERVSLLSIQTSAHSLVE